MGGPYTRMVMIQKLVTELISMERMTMKYERGHEVRPYLERIIHTARFGPKVSHFLDPFLILEFIEHCCS